MYLQKQHEQRVLKEQQRKAIELRKQLNKVKERRKEVKAEVEAITTERIAQRALRRDEEFRGNKLIIA